MLANGIALADAIDEFLFHQVVADRSKDTVEAQMRILS